MAAITTYGDVSPAIAAYAVVRLLERAMPYLHLEKFGQTYPIPTNSTLTAKFRRYYLQGAQGAAGPDNGAGVNGAGTPFFIPVATTPLQEGVTPTGTLLANQDYTVTLAQYGNFVTFTDVIQDTHTDPILAQMTDTLGEQAAVTIETIRYNVLKAGTNVWYANLVGSRNAIITPIALTDQRRVTTGLNRQNARKISSVVASTTAFNTKSVEAAYMAVCHPDLESDLRNIPGFVTVANYGPHTSPFEGEIGSLEQVRYLTSTVIAPYPDAGGLATTNNLRSTSGTYADVYPILYFGRDAYGIVPLKGKSSITPMIVNPKPAASDPMAQRGTCAWKCYQATVILQDAYMARCEVGASN
ncbi:MAG TPA: N4-gp56 family major capsid protein [Candidatus Saccharimonadia bacterium]|nr:N4-gp56 family major capsid protein [Candidatus Saccharimonadia bacterium]